MGKYIDSIIIFLITAFSTYILCNIIFRNILLSIFISIFTATAFLLLFKALFSNKSKKSMLSSFILYCIIHDNNRFYLLLNEAYKNEFSISKDKNQPFFNNCPLYTHIKFSPLSLDGLISIYKQAKENDAKKIYIIYYQRDKKLPYMMSLLYDLEIKLIPIRTIYKKLRKKKLLPVFEKKPNTHAYFKIVLYHIFDKKMILKYILLSLLTFGLSFITPIKTYYYTISIILFIMSIISFILFVIDPKDTKPFH